MKHIKLLFISLLLVSCTVINKRTYYKLVYPICNNDYYYANYKGEDNYKNFYIVDTIDIKDPVTSTTFLIFPFPPILPGFNLILSAPFSMAIIANL